SSSKLPRAWQARVLLRLATLHSRRGDFRRADGLFCVGMKGAGGTRTILEKDELLFFLNEDAAMNVIAGTWPRALGLCEAGGRLAGRSRSFRLREVALNLHATRGNVALRTFRFEEAIQTFETALEIAEMIAPPASEAIILNNLGVVYSQSDRYE